MIIWFIIQAITLLRAKQSVLSNYAQTRVVNVSRLEKTRTCCHPIASQLGIRTLSCPLFSSWRQLSLSSFSLLLSVLSFLLLYPVIPFCLFPKHSQALTHFCSLCVPFPPHGTASPLPYLMTATSSQSCTRSLLPTHSGLSSQKPLPSFLSFFPPIFFSPPLLFPYNEWVPYVYSLYCSNYFHALNITFPCSFLCTCPFS